MAQAEPANAKNRSSVANAEQLNLRMRLHRLQNDVDSIRSDYEKHRVPSSLVERWRHETYYTSFARTRVVALFALLYAFVSITLHPQIREFLLTGANAVTWQGSSIVRVLLVLASLTVLCCTFAVFRRQQQLALRWYSVIVKLYLVVLLSCAALEVAIYPSDTPDLTGFAVAMVLAAVVLITPNYFRVPLYLLASATASIGWWWWHGTGSQLFHVSVYSVMIAALCIALDRLTHRQRVSALLSLRRAELQESIARELLDNTLPIPISKELASHQGAIAEHHSTAYVLFADLVGFTELAARVSANELLTLLDDIFRRFDTLVMAHDMEKIKTIGDAYMAAGGLTQSKFCSADKAIKLGVAMHDVLDAFNQENNTTLSLRIGVHTGPVVAGVIGDLRFAYDIWGDTVNVASRLESTGIPGRVHISHNLQELLEEKQLATLRGEVNLKGVGSRETWLV
jgi:class 3 adenylate cyclase